jgi:formylglycine-generating enzyme required for sulfatase activity
MAQEQRSPPARCPDGLARVDARCCGAGQIVAAGHCQGVATSCAQGQELEDGACVAKVKRISYPAGSFQYGAADWQQSETQKLGTVSVESFSLDANEVTVARFRPCAAQGECQEPAERAEPGQPVTHVSPEEAERFCRFVGGRLPTSSEWLFAAAGPTARRFPWGNTGLVCRRASFGLVRGPCAHGAATPELAGARPDGKTPDGAFDLAGNVAEWAREADGSFRARGGSFRSTVAAELKTWASESPGERAEHVGFRCAYDR